MPLTPQRTQIILLRPSAPIKPPEGAPCNGCGVCCLAEPCPLGVVLSGRRTGACAALRWVELGALYRCGAVTQPREVLQTALPRLLPAAMRRGVAAVLAPALGRLARRWIASGVGCDSSLEPSTDVPHI